MNALTRRVFGRIAMGLGVLAAGSAGLAGCGRPEPDVDSPEQPTEPRAGVGFVLAHEQFRTEELVGQAQAAERAGFRHLWVSDHLQPWQDNQGHSMFPWLTLALLTHRTDRISLGTGVTCPTFRYHPVTVAQAFASLAILAPDRVFLGLGTGERLNEQAGTGQWAGYRERHDRLVEAIQLIRELWSGRRISFSGRYFQTEELRLYDLPERLPPIYVAAAGPKSARLAGQYGDGWIAQGADVTKPELVGALEQGARATGRGLDEIDRRAELYAVVGDRGAVEEAARLWRFTAGAVDQPNPVAIQRAAEANTLTEVAQNWATGTDPGGHIEAVQAILDAGATPFLHFPQRDPLTAIEFYRREVLPALH
ncbi:F420-dependent hydroxymycolic acid dehydrogenase [Mycobacterium sp. 1274756.6]|uniref:F420-dependent hydroxymycolic acid dehydrogenase n=1 Tax=Mycobacterium sp. 1274756.6 TaxID=1834076 RepID=UPI00080012BF|nr:F420-dependent hydroxymycolic acid dehydrogenase [Mycobacterium sp. 1274756.6]OBJ69680.1 F420-dependent hydroxymycolic acid dehydrogenase [Mycobacterium sp. 1274756.6]